MTFQAHIIGAKARWGFGWVPIPNGPSFVSTYDWPGLKQYATASGLPVRELDARGVVVREYYPAIGDE